MRVKGTEWERRGLHRVKNGQNRREDDQNRPKKRSKSSKSPIERKKNSHDRCRSFSQSNICFLIPVTMMKYRCDRRLPVSFSCVRNVRQHKTHSLSVATLFRGHSLCHSPSTHSRRFFSRTKLENRAKCKSNAFPKDLECIKMRLLVYAVLPVCLIGYGQSKKKWVSHGTLNEPGSILLNEWTFICITRALRGFWFWSALRDFLHFRSVFHHHPFLQPFAFDRFWLNSLNLAVAVISIHNLLVVVFPLSPVLPSSFAVYYYYFFVRLYQIKYVITLAHVSCI